MSEYLDEIHVTAAKPLTELDKQLILSIVGNLSSPVEIRISTNEPRGGMTVIERDTPKRWDVYWLIEKRGLPQVMWLKADGEWTLKAHEALWFVRKDDAEKHRIAAGHDFVRIVVCDHAFAKGDTP